MAQAERFREGREPGIDIFDVERLEGWALNIERYGGNLTEWADPQFIIRELRRFASVLRPYAKAGALVQDKQIAALKSVRCRRCGHMAGEHLHLFGSTHYLCPTVLLFEEATTQCGCSASNQPRRDLCGENRCICRCHAEASR